MKGLSGECQIAGWDGKTEGPLTVIEKLAAPIAADVMRARSGYESIARRSPTRVSEVILRVGRYITAFRGLATGDLSLG